MLPDSLSQFVEILTPVVLEAGQYAMQAQGKVGNIQKDDDADAPEFESDFVKQRRQAKTVIDEEVQEKLLIAVYDAFGADVIRLDAEEDTPSKALFTSQNPEITLVIDPIDGTLEYLNGAPEYSVCVALVAEGKVLIAFVYFPVFKTLYLLDSDGKFYVCECESQSIIRKSLVQGPKVLQGKTVYVNHRLITKTIVRISKKFNVIKDSDAEVDWTQALLKCISGEYDAALFVKPQIRDVLLGAMIESMPNGYAVDFQGRKIVWPDGGRIPEVVFGFGVLSEEIKTCLS